MLCKGCINVGLHLGSHLLYLLSGGVLLNGHFIEAVGSGSVEVRGREQRVLYVARLLAESRCTSCVKTECCVGVQMLKLHAHPEAGCHDASK